MLTGRDPSDARIRDEWLPDPEVWHFIHDCLGKRFNIEVARLDERWIPLGIVGTLVWLEVTGWWIINNSGIEATGEQFDSVHKYDGEELSPRELLILRWAEEKAAAALEARWQDAGLQDDEQGELLGFLRRRCYESSGVPNPSESILISIAWGTLVWSLTEKGKSWMSRLDQLFDCTLVEGVAYQESSERGKTLLDGALVEDTERGLGECAKCNMNLWCVRVHCHQGELTSLCFNCYLEEKEHIQYNWITWDESVNTMCNWDSAKPNLDCSSCGCPHAIDQAKENLNVWALDKMKERGSQRLLEFEENAERVGQCFGKSPEELIRYFRGN